MNYDQLFATIKHPDPLHLSELDYMELLFPHTKYDVSKLPEDINWQTKEEKVIKSFFKTLSSMQERRLCALVAAEMVLPFVAEHYKNRAMQYINLAYGRINGTVKQADVDDLVMTDRGYALDHLADPNFTHTAYSAARYAAKEMNMGNFNASVDSARSAFTQRYGLEYREGKHRFLDLFMGKCLSRLPWFRYERERFVGGKKVKRKAPKIEVNNPFD